MFVSYAHDDEDVVYSELARLHRQGLTWTFALFDKGSRLAWRDKPELVEPQLAGLRKLGIE